MGKPSTDRGAIMQTVRALVNDGWKLNTVDNGDTETVANETEAVDAITAVDEARLFVTKVQNGSAVIGWVFFVLGNDPDEVINDHTINLSPVLDPLMEQWEA